MKTPNDTESPKAPTPSGAELDCPDVTGYGLFIGKAKLIVAIGKFGGGCVMEVIESNVNLDDDLLDMGQYLDDLFAEGSELPKESGLYLFEGETRAPFGDEWYHYGRFTPHNTEHRREPQQPKGTNNNE